MANKIFKNRNIWDYIITDSTPTELPMIFSFRCFYEFINKPRIRRELQKLSTDYKTRRYDDATLERDFFNCLFPPSFPYRYSVKHRDAHPRNLSIPQPLGALNMAVFISVYGDDFISFLQQDSFSMRHPTNTISIAFKSAYKRAIQYTGNSNLSILSGQERTGTFFDIKPFYKMSNLLSSPMINRFQSYYKYVGKTDISNCFYSIYTHSFAWVRANEGPEARRGRSKDLFHALDSVNQSLNIRETHGLLVGPEYSRACSEIILQQIDIRIKERADKMGCDYRILRFVDDYVVYSNSKETIEEIIGAITEEALRFHLIINSAKTTIAETLSEDDPLPLHLRFVVDNLTGSLNTIFSPETSPENRDKAIKQFKNLRRKDYIGKLFSSYADRGHQISAYFLSVFWNCLCKDNYSFTKSEQKIPWKMSSYLLELILLIYTRDVRFSSTDKFVSILHYLIKVTEEDDGRLIDTINRWILEFAKEIFSGDHFMDYANLLLFMKEYCIELPFEIGEEMLTKASIGNDPIIFGLLFFCKDILNDVTQKRLISQIQNGLDAAIATLKTFSECPMECKEFWWILIFKNSNPFGKIVQNYIGGITIPQKASYSSKITLSFLKEAGINGCFLWDAHFSELIETCIFKSSALTRLHRSKASFRVDEY